MSVLSQLHELGIRVRLINQSQIGVSPWSLLDDQKRDFVRRNKQQIIAELKGGTSRVGTVLERLIERKIPSRYLSKLPKEKCGCKKYAEKMNRWGIEGCKQRQDEIVSHLVQQSEGIGLGWVPLSIRELIARKILMRAINIERRRLGL